MRVAILTSDSQRHYYFAGRLANSFEVVGAFVESKQYKPEESCETSEDREVLARWFAMREAAETRFFAREAQEFSANAREHILRVDAGKINTPEIVERLRTLSPEVVAVFGSSLIRAELLGAVKKPFVNMHLGLSPYYRGSGTNFWP